MYACFAKRKLIAYVNCIIALNKGKNNINYQDDYCNYDMASI